MGTCLRLTMPRPSVVVVFTGARQRVQREFSVLATSQFSRLEQLERRALVAQMRRKLSDKTPKQAAAEVPEAENDETAVVPLTPGQKVQVGFKVGLWGAGLGLALAGGYCIVCELFPTHMSPHSIFDKAFETVRYDERVSRVYGDPVKGYGRDVGRSGMVRSKTNRTSRNFIENTEYDEPSDGSKRVRVRFNIEGPYAEGIVFAEVSNKTKEFVYVMVQDKRTGRVINIQDNRLALQAGSSLRSDSERDALAGLIGGSSGKY